MGNQELTGKAKELVERKRKVIRAGLELLIKTGGSYSEEDKKNANDFANESQRIASEREMFLKQAWDELNFEVITILEIGFFDAIREEVEKFRQKMDEIFSSKKNRE